VRINLTSIFVDDQRKALTFYCDVLGFEKCRDVPIGDDSWLTVVSPESPSGPELLLEPAGHPAVKPFRQALAEDGIPAACRASRGMRMLATCKMRMGIVAGCAASRGSTSEGTSDVTTLR
jgi:catechol 2,3-dioxygenase-like lactoylglutathione lyase family enzyme